jgi:hypothetical protein
MFIPFALSSIPSENLYTVAGTGHAPILDAVNFEKPGRHLNCGTFFVWYDYSL